MMMGGNVVISLSAGTPKLFSAKMVVSTIPLLFLTALICAGLATAANLEDVLETYETLHPLQLKHHIVKRDLSDDEPNIRQLEFDSLGRHFRLSLHRRRDLLAPGFKIYSVDGQDQKHEFHMRHHGHPYIGYIIGEPSTEVHAVWEDEDNVASTIITPEDTYIIEPSWRHLPKSDNFSMIAYRKSSMKFKHGLGKPGESYCGYINADKDEFSPNPDYHHPEPPQDAEEKDEEGRHKWDEYADMNVRREKRQAGKAEGGSPQASRFSFKPTKTTCQVLLVADYRFFENMGRKSLSKTSSYLIGLLDRVDSIYRSTDFGNGYIGMGFEIKEIRIHEMPTYNWTGKFQHYNRNTTGPWKTKKLLEAFSYNSSSKFCLAHLFTMQGVWADAVGMLGLSYVASPSWYEPGGICSRDYYKSGGRMFLNTGWSSALNRYKRRLLTQEADLVTTHEFGHNWGSEHDPDTTDCSPSAFNGGKHIMYTYSVSGYDPNNKIFSPCSTRSIGAVLKAKAQSCFEVKRESFCGNSHVEAPHEECDVGPEGQKGEDPCCDRHCKLKPTAMCSNQNDLCCTSDCQFAPSSVMCHEGFNTTATCEGDSNCTGYSATCPPPAPKKDGTNCLDRGECNNGVCMPFCETKGKVSCICDEVKTSCFWCCKENGNSTCLPYLEGTSTINLPEGMPCVQGFCKEGGLCERQVQDLVQRIWNIIENITPDQVVEFMRANIVGTVIVLSLILWIPISCIVSWKDRKMKREEREAQSWLRADNTSLVRPQDEDRIKPQRKVFQRQSMREQLARQQSMGRSATYL